MIVRTMRTQGEQRSSRLCSYPSLARRHGGATPQRYRARYLRAQATPPRATRLQRCGRQRGLQSDRLASLLVECGRSTTACLRGHNPAFQFTREPCSKGATFTRCETTHRMRAGCIRRRSNPETSRRYNEEAPSAHSLWARWGAGQHGCNCFCHRSYCRHSS